MEADSNPMPHFELFHPMESLKKMAGFLLDRVRTEPRLVASEHYRPPEVLVGELKDVPMPIIFGYGSEGDYRD